MIIGLDHVVVLLENIESGVKAYELLLGRAPSRRSQSDGAETVLFTLDNMSLELVAPMGEGEAADRVRKAMRVSPASAFASTMSRKPIVVSSGWR